MEKDQRERKWDNDHVSLVSRPSFCARRAGCGACIVIDPSTTAPAIGPAGELIAAMARNQSWLNAFEQGAEIAEPYDEKQPNPLPLLGIAGPGFFVVNDRGMLRYGRVGKFHVAEDGRVLDNRDREVMGFTSADPGVAPSVLRVPADLMAANRFGRYEIDEQGALLGIERDTARNNKTSRPSLTPATRKVELGRLCIAIFPAPERLAFRGGSEAAATKGAGTPQYLPSGSAHVGTVYPHPLQPSLEAMRENLRALWTASAHAEIEVAIAASNDVLSHVALNLVK
jgi:hypothetical protein